MTSIVKLGSDVLVEKQLDLLSGKRIGIITNNTGVSSTGEHVVDLLIKAGVDVKTLFGPEHGIRGDAPDGVFISSEKDPATGLPVHSLYGENTKPTREMLQGLDVLVYDIQDVGSRYYTIVSTMSLAAEAAGEMGIEFVVLDRPNPIDGIKVEGNILEPEFSSFVGMYPIPNRHGLTVGELLSLFVGEDWLKNGVKPKFTVVRMEGWKRSMWWDETGLEWIKPSPNMTTLDTATVYPGTCFIEGTNVSEGRGTPTPFLCIGANWISDKRLADAMNSHGLSGVSFEPIAFTPVEVPKVASKPKYAGKLCRGLKLNVTDREVFEPVKMGIYLLWTIADLFYEYFEWRQSAIDRLTGTNKVRIGLDKCRKPAEIMGTWDEEINRFLKIRQKYLLYD